MSLQQLQQIFHSIDTQPAATVTARDITERISAIDFGDNIPPEARYEVMAFSLVEQTGNGIDSIGEYFGPQMEGRDEAGNAVQFPDMRQIIQEHIAYWERRADEAIHPFLKARYCGLVWDLTAPVTNRPTPHQFRIHYIQACIQLIQKALFPHPIQRISCLLSVIEIATKFNDRNYFEVLKQLALDIEQQLHLEDPPGKWGFVYDYVLKNKKFALHAAEEAAIIERLEEKLAIHSRPDEQGRADPWGVKVAAIRLAEYYESKKRFDDVRRVILAVGAAFETLLETATPMQAAGWLKDLYLLYLTNRLNQDAEVILAKHRKYAELSASQMAAMAQQIQLPREEVDAYIDSLFAADPGLFANIAQHFVPDRNLAEEQVKQLAPQHPLQFSTKLEIVDAKGRLIATIGPVSEDLSGRTIIRQTERIEFQSFFLHLAFRRGIDEGLVSVETILKHLSLSDIVAEERMDIVAHALEYYFAGNYLVFLHLAIPQIEEAIRNLVDIAGGKVMRFKDGAFRLKTFDDILNDPLVNKILGEDRQSYLRILFTDPRGFNLRNIICHGLEGMSIFNEINANRVVHVLIMVGFIRFNTEPVADTPAT